MTGVCTCKPDDECPVHGLDLGVNVRRAQRCEAGGCNFCTRPHQQVYEVSGTGPNRLAVRFCPACWKELR